MHGDAAFAGQGILAECLVLGALHGFEVGGTIQVIVNNLLGFTAVPEESNASRFATDIAKRLPIPIFHVNAEDPDAVIRVAAIAAEYRHRFHTDVVVDLIGYRRHGHSEVDDPTVTQPRRYAAIKDHPPLYKLYADRIGLDPSAEVQRVHDEFLEGQKAAAHARQKAEARHPSRILVPRITAARCAPTTTSPPACPSSVSPNSRASPPPFRPASTFTPRCKNYSPSASKWPLGKRAFDYGMAELTAFASLVTAGTPVRLSGQDSQRGTFNTRHSIVIDIETEAKYVPLAHLSPDQARFEVYNSMLSEAAVLGFEYGYSRDYPETLVLWEAQFGDFANGAQIIIDQFVAAGEAKWNLLSGLVLLLPHGYEGQGPEHSSARIERYLHLAANDNMQICQPSTAAQYFHLLRRQALRALAQTAHRLHPQEHARATPTPPRNSPTSPRRASSTSSPTRPSPRPAACSSAPARSATTSASSAKSGRTPPSPSSSLSRCTPGPKPRCRRRSISILKPPRLSGCRRSPPTWARASTSCHTCVVWPATAPYSASSAVASPSPATGSAKAHELEEKALINLAFGA